MKFGLHPQYFILAFFLFLLQFYINCHNLNKHTIKDQSKVDKLVSTSENMLQNILDEDYVFVDQENQINSNVTGSNELNIRKVKCDFKKLKEKIKLNKRLVNVIGNLTDRNDAENLNNNKINSTSLNITNNANNPNNPNNPNNTSSPNSITSDDLLTIIADQTENIKNEICSTCLEINSSLNILIEEIKKIKKTLNKYNSSNSTTSTSEAIMELSNCINNLNLIKADLFKLNEILDTLQKANCNNFLENSKKYTLVLNSTNKLSEVIQNVLRVLSININLVVLN